MGDKGKELYMYLLGIVIVLSIIGVICLLIFFAMPLINKDVLMVIVGVLAAKFGSVIDYFYGSSKSSADKNAIMAKDAADKTQLLANPNAEIKP